MMYCLLLRKVKPPSGGTADRGAGFKGGSRKRPPGGVWGGSTNKHYAESGYAGVSIGASGIYRCLACHYVIRAFL